MPRPVDVNSESEDEPVITASVKKTYASKKRRATSASESDAGVVTKDANEEPDKSTAEDEDEDGEEEEEYEIEKILDSKKGHFTGGRMGYFVKWKNYGEEHNSWVDETDAGNAKELIERYWAEKKKNKTGPRKSEPVKPRPKLSEKLSRKSLADLDMSVESDGMKKRGRTRKDDLPSGGRDDEGDEQRAKKKQRKSNGVARKDDKPESEDEEVIGDMKKYMKVPSWDELIESVDTVEREEDGELYVFFTLKNDQKRVRENSRICAEKFPQKLIMFYESNLRWKTEEDPNAEAE